MNSIIVACNTIADELNMAIQETNCRYPVLWIESGLHLDPGSLKTRLQNELDRIGNVKRVILAFGYCGNALLGLCAGDFQIVFPRVDDCITLLLGSPNKRQEVSDEMGTYFLTKGWLDFESNIWSQYQETVKRMGKVKADRVFRIMLQHYRRLGVIDTGAYDLESILENTKYIAGELKLDHHVLPGTLDYLKKLLTGPWDADFVTIDPGESVNLQHLLLQKGPPSPNFLLAQVADK